MQGELGCAVPMYETVLRAEKELPAPHATGRVRLAGKDAVAAGTHVVPLFAVAAQAVVDTITHL